MNALVDEMKNLVGRIQLSAALVLLLADAPAVDALAPAAGMLPAAPFVAGRESPKPQVLKAASFKHYVDAFNQSDTELYSGFISNGMAWDFLKENAPLLECPDKDIEEIYYFRWWTYRKHIKQTPAGFVITEFLPPVAWAGKYNSIDCAAGHHFHEGRWLADARYLDDYAVFWFRKGGEPRRYSFWAAEALWACYQVTGDDRVIKELLPDLMANYEAWEREHRDANGLFWQGDDRDGMEVSIGGSGYRPTLMQCLTARSGCYGITAGTEGWNKLAWPSTRGGTSDFLLPQAMRGRASRPSLEFQVSMGNRIGRRGRISGSR